MVQDVYDEYHTPTHYQIVDVYANSDIDALMLD